MRGHGNRQISTKKIDFIVTVILLLLGAGIGFYVPVTNPILAVVYLGIPSLYLVVRKRKNYRKIGWGLLLLGVLLGGIFEFIATMNGAWAVPRLMFPWATIGDFPIESIVGYVFMTLFILVFYEHFIDDERHPKLSRNHSLLLGFLLAALLVVVILHVWFPAALTFSYFYVKTGVLAVLFPLVFAFLNPRIISKFTTLAFFFFFVWLLIELVGVHNQNWTFPTHGEFLGTVSLFGISFPFEEIFFWCMWYAATVVAYYEYFIDDQR